MESTGTFTNPNSDNNAQLQVLRRSRSEGPSPAHGAVHRTEPGLMAAWVGRRRHVTNERPAYWLPVAVPTGFDGKSGPVKDHYQQLQQEKFTTSEYRLQFAWPPGKPNMQPTDTKESVHLPATGVTEKEMPRHVTDFGDAGFKVNEERFSEEIRVNEDKPRRRRYKTEYRKKYRPFSLYQYVDGRFQKPPTHFTDSGYRAEDAADPWYREVLELRKKAGEYKFRGWGGELLPEHMVDLYAKQFDVWEQVSRRSSLSALALAAASPRNEKAINIPKSASKPDKDKVNQKRSSPNKIAPIHQRPGYAQPASARKDPQRKSGDETDRPKRDASQQRSISAEGKSPRSKPNKPKSPAHTSLHGNVTLAVRPSLGAIFHPANSSRSTSVGPEGRTKKTTPATNLVTKTTPTKDRHTRSEKEGKINDKTDIKVTNEESKAGDKQEPVEQINHDETSLCPPVPIVEPDITLVKSPPEPTRVKSPDQIIIRSPDPVNWTVPLDTGKTFTVTQNIREGDNSRPHSELKFSVTVRPSHPAKGGNESGPSAVHVVHALGVPGSKDNTTIHGTSDFDNLQTSDSDKQCGMVSSEKVNTLEMVTDKKDNADNEENGNLSENAISQENEGSTGKDSETVKDILNLTKADVNEELLNGHSDHSKSNHEKSTEQNMNEGQQPELSKPTVPPPAVPLQPVKSVPGTTLRCLEDPSYLFSSGGAPSRAGPSVEAKAPSTSKGPRYRVLEAPSESLPQYKVLEAPGIPSDVVYQPISSTPVPLSSTSSPYKVLEAPSTTSSSSGNAPSIVSPTSSPASRSLASDVLEKARTRFDRFWGKKDGDK